MADDIYRKVQQQLDQYSIGFPETESGVEIEILKLLFTEDEAEMFNKMHGELETPQSVADRIGRPEEDVAQDLERLAQKGLLNLLIFEVAVTFIWGMVGALIVPMVLYFTTSDKLGALITIVFLFFTGIAVLLLRPSLVENVAVRVVTVFVIAVVANAVNIIDGFNRLAWMCVVIILARLAYVWFALGDTPIAALALVGIGAVLGFFV